MSDPMEDRRCTAMSKQSRERCKRSAVVGGTVCAMHGGKAPAVAAAAERRHQEAAADQAVRKLWPGLDQASPVKDPVANMERLAGALTEMLDVVGTKVNDLSNVAAGTGLTQLRGELVLLDKVAGHLRQLLEAMARLGIAERHLALEEERANIITTAYRLGVEAGMRHLVELLAADRRAADVLPLIEGLLPQVVGVMLDQFMDGLGEVVPGEVAS